MHFLKKFSLATAAALHLCATGALAQQSQAELDNRALELRNAPEIRTARNRLLHALESDPVANSLGSRLPSDTDEIVMGAIQSNINADRACPVLFRFFAPAHHMNGIDIPAAKFLMTNPDTVFRYFPIDSKGQYRIEGHFDAPRSTYLSLHVYGVGSGFGGRNFMSDDEFKVDADGGFVITIGPKDATNKAPNHLEIGPKSARILIRETVADWAHERVSWLTVQRVDTIECERVGDPEVITRTVRAIDATYEQLKLFRDRKFLNMPPNTIQAPVPYPDSKWARVAYGRFDLADDQVMVIHYRALGARYVGIQTADRATGSIEPNKRPSSLNNRQAKADPDGSYTVLLSPHDPGFSNWIDTGGIREGQIWMRWQGLPGQSSEIVDAISSVSVIPRANLASVIRGTGLRRVTPAERQIQYELHKAEYDRRFCAQ